MKIKKKTKVSIRIKILNPLSHFNPIKKNKTSEALNVAIVIAKIILNFPKSTNLAV